MASEFEPRNPEFEALVRDSFAKQQVMALIGAEMTTVEPGAVEITLPTRDDLTQQHGFVHAGIVTTIVDSACGYAALTLAPASSDVLTIEYKVNFMEPASGERLIARGRVLRAGRTITVCAGDVSAVRDGREQPVATMLATMRIMPGRPD
ncbi:MAG TPA: PaaI family thioesterase [Ktedonobacterales bacterium]|nr:PaaI family thioesterase [Ktedonobacterales bacterium]